MLPIILGVLLIPSIVVIFSCVYFKKRRQIDYENFERPINESLKKIFLSNFKEEDFEGVYQRNFMVIPKGGIKKRIHDIGSMCFEILSFSKKNKLQTIVVDDVNNKSKIMNKIYEEIAREVIPFKIFKNFPLKWREYISWKLLSENPPKGYENLILQREKELKLKEDDLKVFQIIMNPSKMFEYLEETYEDETKKGFDFLREGAYKIAKTVEDPSIFNWIFNRIKSKELRIIQVLLPFKRDIYFKLIKKSKYALIYNITQNSFDLILELDDELKNKKVKHKFYSNLKNFFGIITHGED